MGRHWTGATVLSAKRAGIAMREQRELAGLSIFEVARRIAALRSPSGAVYRFLARVSAWTISNWERGKTSPTLPALDAYARVCGVSLREVIP